MILKSDLANIPAQAGKVVSLYSGAGGMDIGFRLAGFEVVWSNDIDKDAVDSYRTIFPEHNSTVGDLLQQDIPRLSNIDLVVGGPPCQGFSVAGRMDPADPRSRHVWNFLAVVQKIQPRAFVMENVKALAVNKRWQDLLTSLTKEAGKLGYNTKLFLLNACQYGVPQARERMFLIGLQEGVPVCPQPTTPLKTVSVRKALQSLPAFGHIGNDSICTAKITLAKSPVLRKSPYAGMLFNGQGRALNIDIPSLTLPASMGGNRTPIVDQRQIETGEENWIVQYHRHLLNGGQPNLPVPDRLRRITVEEAAMIQTFPADMEFCGSQSSRYRQIGNAVPPLLAYEVAKAMKSSLSPAVQHEPTSAVAL